MKKMLLTACLLGAAFMGGCANMPQSFSCAPTPGAFRVDADAYRQPAKRDAAGYLHC